MLTTIVFVQSLETVGYIVDVPFKTPDSDQLRPVRKNDAACTLFMGVGQQHPGEHGPQLQNRHLRTVRKAEKAQKWTDIEVENAVRAEIEAMQTANGIVVEIEAASAVEKEVIRPKEISLWLR